MRKGLNQENKSSSSAQSIIGATETFRSSLSRDNSIVHREPKPLRIALLPYRGSDTRKWNLRGPERSDKSRPAPSRLPSSSAGTSRLRRSRGGSEASRATATPRTSRDWDSRRLQAHCSSAHKARAHTLGRRRGTGYCLDPSALDHDASWALALGLLRPPPRRRSLVIASTAATSLPLSLTEC